MKTVLFGKSLRELQQLCRDLAWPAFRAKQLYQALYAQSSTSFAGITVLGKAERKFLEQNYDLAYYPALAQQNATDGTVKFLYPLDNSLGNSSAYPAAPSNAAIEGVLIPQKSTADYTLCLSSQWGCRWACQFCQTGELGLKRSLSCGEILAQLRYALVQGFSVTRLVFMGMGEPMENPHLEQALAILSDDVGGYGLSARRITVSTVGLAAGLEAFFDFAKPYRLALSVHNPISEERSQLIPAEFSSPLEEVVQGIERRQKQGDMRRITFEYTLIAAENDQDYHAEALAKLALRIGARVNLITCHENRAGYLGSSKLHAFQVFLEQRKIRCTIRKSQGEEIQAACGMLAGKVL